ncbi:hypothetical protein UFOVP227_24 [uncultured Caudovirales phage]|uniref:Uncharacterized protein n=1 Tax=uncultured Caudovirales phage TaxID=2100421 RepID=A0A6J7WLU6_9CAUD|nr:hypothetical protein UFOVP227_24 [uncultured Caudovirales phage]
MSTKTFTSTTLSASDLNTYCANSGLVYVASYTFSSNTAPYIDNCFSSTYDNYKIVINATSTSNNTALFKFRTGGADNSTSNYFWGGFYINIAGSASLTPESSGGAVTNGRYGAYSTNGNNFAEIMVSMPYSASQKTTFISNHQSAENYVRMMNGYFDATTSFDGIKIYNATLTGTMTVYGMRKA